jgi:ABC-2 type transport system ATP-binding protein
MITISQLTKSYGRKIQALRGLDLEIGAGMFGLVGPNGAGKTTLMRILAGLLKPSSGRVNVLGNDPSSIRGKLAIRSLLGYLPQELGLYPDLTGLEFLEYIALLKGIREKSKRQKQLDELLELVSLTEVAHRKMRTFSSGMKRRVGIAQALLGSPQLLIVDEPTSGLDPEERVRFRNLLADLAGRCTVILSTHIIEDISQSCTSMAVIYHGQVLFGGSPGELIANANGKVWQITTDGRKPGSGVDIVSTRQTQKGTEYRVLAEGIEGFPSESVVPSLEDGYLWLMQKARENHNINE